MQAEGSGSPVRKRSKMSVSMFQRKLQALGYPGSLTPSVQDISSLRPVVSWLENQKIRQLTVEERKWLADASLSDEQWCSKFDQYMVEMEVPDFGEADSLATPFAVMEATQRQQCIDWLLRRAVALEYHDNAQTIRSKGSSSVMFAGAGTLDFSSPEFLSTLEEARAVVGVQPSDNPLLVLKAVVRELIYRARDTELGSGVSSSDSMSVEDRLKGSPLGFSTGDERLDRFALGLRLLYVSDIRELQSQVDELIVAMQECTANPKTNTSLGKVGR